MIRFGKPVGDGVVRIAVIGGGADGAAVVGEFLRRGSAACELIWMTRRSVIGRLRDQGRLQVVAGRVSRIEGSAPLALTYRRGNSTVRRVVRAK